LRSNPLNRVLGRQTTGYSDQWVGSVRRQVLSQGSQSSNSSTIDRAVSS
jgi:hypothetical protein